MEQIIENIYYSIINITTDDFLLAKHEIIQNFFKIETFENKYNLNENVNKAIIKNEIRNSMYNLKQFFKKTGHNQYTIVGKMRFNDVEDIVNIGTTIIINKFKKL